MEALTNLPAASLFLQVMTLADITNSAGTKLSEWVTNPRYSQPSQQHATFIYPNQAKPNSTVWNDFIKLQAPPASFYRWYQQQVMTTPGKLVPRLNFSSVESSFLPSRPQDLLARNRTPPYGSSLRMTVHPSIPSMALPTIVTNIDLSN
jgi:hypothetical protein